MHLWRLFPVSMETVGCNAATKLVVFFGADDIPE